MCGVLHTIVCQVIYVEAISNPLMQVPDLPGVVAFAKQHGLTSVIDATFATPVLFRPASIGFDLVIHSATKYLNGHSDIIAGGLARVLGWGGVGWEGGEWKKRRGAAQ